MSKTTLLFPSMSEALKVRAERTPDKVAFRYLRDGEIEAGVLTYKSLYEGALNVAAALLASTKPGERALLIYPPGLDFIKAFYGCVLAGVVAVPLYPPTGRRRLGRLESVANDCRPAVALTTADIKKQSEGWFDNIESMTSVKWIESDTLSQLPVPELPELSDHDILFLQYTSGSTGEPKGVMVSRLNVVHNAHCIMSATDTESVMTGWLPIYHDMGLIGQIAYALYAGTESNLMAPVDFIKKPVRWLQSIHNYKAEGSQAPNFAYDLCVEQISDEDIEGLDLSHFRMFLNGAEPIKASTQKRFIEKFRKVGIREDVFLPCYGMAETTLMITGFRHVSDTLFADKAEMLAGRVKPVDAAAPNSVELVTSGPIREDFTVRIVNPDTMVECAPHEIGEIWIQGVSVALGYYNKPELTEEIFHASILDAHGKVRTELGEYLRTGDMGFFHNDLIYISGRIKEMFIINGANYYPQDIEATIQAAHPALQSNAGAVFAVEDEHGNQQLVAFQEIARAHALNFNADEIVQAITEAVVQTHELSLSAVLLISPGRVPKTTSGKIQRSLCRKLFLENAPEGVLHTWSAREVRAKKAEDRQQQPSARPKMDLSNHPMAAQIQGYMRREIAKAIGVPDEQVDLDTSFASLGLSSIQGIQLAEKLSKLANREIPASVLYDYHTINALTAHLLGIEPEQQATTVRKETTSEPLAIIGLACKLPGAENPNQFWENLITQTDSIQEVPENRWDYKQYYSDTPAPGKMNTKWGGFMKDVDQFDAAFFAIAPREADYMDPQQRIVLEQTYLLLESAGYGADALKGSDTGVFLGISHSNYSDLLTASPMERNIYGATGSSLSVAANRISYVFDFHGPSLSIDTACSSSLVAIHQAVAALRRGECGMAIAGGVNLLLTPDVNMSFSTSGLTAANGRCKTFDANADGIVRSDGCALILLKPLSRAIADGDRIVALVHGSAVNQDGRSNGLTAPNGLAQQQVIRAAVADAGIAPNQVAYVETHGTGTVLGDPIEVNALGAVYGANRSAPLILGAVKANIGHTEAAAGAAGVIKAAMALHQKMVPGQANFNSPNPGIQWAQLNATVAKENTPLQEEKPYAGVSSFGFGGTNAHVILGAYVPAPAENDDTKLPARKAQIIALSAKDEKALRQRCTDLLRHITLQTDASVADLGYTSLMHRDHMARRWVTTAANREQLRQHLEVCLSGEEAPWVYRAQLKLAKRKVAFLFTGAGVQYAGMGKAFYDTEPAFAEALDACFHIARNHMDDDLKKLMFCEPGSDEEKRLHGLDIMQPAVFAYEYAMYKWWESLGVVPEVVIGHSLGEIAAACAAGVMTLPDAMHLTILRGRLIHNMPVRGTMASVQATEDEVLPVIKGKEDRITIGVINGNTQTVVSGVVEDVEAVVAHFDAQGRKTKLLRIAAAGHSPLMDAITAPFKQTLETFTFGEARIPLISNVSGKVAGPDIHTPQYWVDHLRRTVRFADGVHTLAELGCNVLVEVGPQPTLLGIARFEMPGVDNLLLLPSATEEDKLMTTAHYSVACYHAEGGKVDWKAYFHRRHGRKVAMPGYPFQRSRYWVELPQHNASATGKSTGLPLLETALPIAGVEGVFETHISLDSKPYLADHRLADMLVAPGAMLTEVVLEYMAHTGRNWRIEQIAIERPLFLPENGAVKVQLVATRDPYSEAVHAEVFSTPMGSEDAWTIHAKAVLQPASAVQIAAIHPAETAASFAERLDASALYKALNQAGLQYGPAFQGIRDIAKNGMQAFAKLSIDLPESDAAQAQAHQLHPALLDASFQMLAALHSEKDNIYLPFALAQVEVLTPGLTEALAIMKAKPLGTSDELLSCSVTLYTTSGEGAARFDFTCKKATAAQVAAANTSLRTDWTFEPRWIPTDVTQNALSRPKAAVVYAQGLPQMARAIAQGTDGSQYTEDWSKAADALANSQSDALLVCWNIPEPGANLPAEVAALCSEALKQLQYIAAAFTDRLRSLKRIYWIGTSFGGSKPSPAAAALWGLGRTFMQEYPNIDIKLIDIEPAISADKLAESLWSLGSENQVRITAQGVRALRIARHAAGRYERRQLTTQATWLITGGLGDLGLKTAHYAATELGIAHLVLTGRKAPDAQATKAIEAMRAAGARVTVAQCDITSREALQKALDAIPAELPLRGIVHVAGVKDDALLKDQNETKFAKVLAPKVQGTWLLHELTAELHIEVFCMYSSLTALAGLAGVANYAVGNIFLDGMAAYRRSIGKEALAIDWGAWTNAGMLAERSLEDLQREMRSRGIGLIEEKPGMQLFGYAATHQLLEPTLIVAPILLNDTAPFELPNGEIAPLYREVLGHAAKALGEVQEKAINLRAILAKAPQEERKAILTEAIQKQVAAVVKRTDHTEIDPEDDIFSFGIDSLMASELIGKLSKALRQQLSPTILFDHRTIASLSEFLLDVALELTEEDGAEADETPARTPQEGAPAQPAQIASPPPTPATSNGNGHPVESPVVKADWEMVIRTTLTRELAARGMNESLIEESWMLRRSVKKLIKLLEKKA